MKTIGLVIFFSSLTCNVTHGQTDSVKINKLTLQVDSLQKEIVNIKNEMVDLKISKNYFDIIVGSQWNIFSTILTGIFVILTLVNFKAIFKDLPKLKSDLQIATNQLKQFGDNLDETKFNSNRAFFLGHFNRNNFDWATIIALRCVELSIKNKDLKGILSWTNQAAEAYDKTNESQKRFFKEGFLVEANHRIDLALGIEDIDDPTYRQQISALREKLNS